MFAALDELKPKIFLCSCIVAFQERKFIERESEFLA